MAPSHLSSEEQVPSFCSCLIISDDSILFDIIRSHSCALPTRCSCMSMFCQRRWKRFKMFRFQCCSFAAFKPSVSVCVCAAGAGARVSVLIIQRSFAHGRAFLTWSNLTEALSPLAGAGQIASQMHLISSVCVVQEVWTLIEGIQRKNNGWHMLVCVSINLVSLFCSYIVMIVILFRRHGSCGSCGSSGSSE